LGTSGASGHSGTSGSSGASGTQGVMGESGSVSLKSFPFNLTFTGDNQAIGTTWTNVGLPFTLNSLANTTAYTNASAFITNHNL
jgi:hypothetical protein